MDSKQRIEGIAVKAGIWYVISNLVVKAISVTTTPIFTRLMSTVDYGTVQTFISWHALLSPLFTLNLTYSIGRAKLDFPDKLDGYIGSMQLLSALFSFVLAGISFVMIKPVSSLLELSPIETTILNVYLSFESAILLYQNGYRYRYKYKQNIAIAWYTALSTTIVSLLLIFTVNGNKADLRMVGICMPTVLLSTYLWRKSTKGKKLNINFEYWKYGLRISLPLILHTISMHILSQSDRIFISKIWGKSDTAFYSLAYTYGLLLNVFTTAVADGWLPWFHDAYYTKRYDDIRKNVKPLIVLGCYIGLACIALAPEAVFILGGKNYVHSFWCVPPIVLGVVCQFIYTHYVNIELHLKKTAYVSGGTIFAAMFNIILNAVFIPKYGYIAAAYTTLASYFALMIIHFTITRQVLKINIYDNKLFFGALVVTTLITGVLVFTYTHTFVRYMIIVAGFGTFLLYFKEYIKNGIKKRY